MESGASDQSDPIFSGLRTLWESEFPKTCGKCGRHYASLDAFLNETASVATGSGIISYRAEAASATVTVCRNCVCGSTLAAQCQDRRDNSPEGKLRRERFQQLLELFVSRGVNESVARAELRIFLRGAPQA